MGQLHQGADREVSTAASQVVDHSALKVNQAGIILTVLLTFIGSFFSLAFLTLIPLLGIVLLLGTFVPQLALFKQLYFKVLKPAGIVKSRPVQDRPEPHNFAQGLGGVFLGIASALLFVTPIASIALALLVAALAFVNLAFGYCLGCQIFFQLEKRGLVRA
jgi:Domain of unknown function (DUF4395)